MTTVEDLGAEAYVSVTTFRKSGAGVSTPVWVVRDGDALAIWTPAGAGKIKRIRRDPAVTVAACDFRGNPRGEAVPGRAEIMSAEGTERVRDLLRKKYGLQGKLSVWLSVLRRGRTGTVGVRISLR
jgi:PPOX class probable F420-dependent enzyme